VQVLNVLLELPDAMCAARHRAIAAPCRSHFFGGCRGGFTLVEALVSLSLTALAGAVILLAMESSLQTSNDVVEQTIAGGLAEQLVDEVLGNRYKEPGISPYQYPLGPNSWEKSGQGRERFNDTDDYHQYFARGARDIWGQPLGEGDDSGGSRHPSLRVRDGFFRDWQQRIDVYYVDENALSRRLPANQTSNFRAVEIGIYRQTTDGSVRRLAKLRRVYAYVPPPS
jgi:type II secretory pathway pseudopilin PulG